MIQVPSKYAQLANWASDVAPSRLSPSMLMSAGVTSHFSHFQFGDTGTSILPRDRNDGPCVPADNRFVWQFDGCVASLGVVVTLLRFLVIPVALF